MSRGSVHNQEGGQSEVGYIKPIKEGMDYLHSLPGEPQVILFSSWMQRLRWHCAYARLALKFMDGSQTRIVYH